MAVKKLNRTSPQPLPPRRVYLPCVCGRRCEDFPYSKSTLLWWPLLAPAVSTSTERFLESVLCFESCRGTLFIHTKQRSTCTHTNHAGAARAISASAQAGPMRRLVCRCHCALQNTAAPRVAPCAHTSDHKMCMCVCVCLPSVVHTRAALCTRCAVNIQYRHHTMHTLGTLPRWCAWAKAV